MNEKRRLLAAYGFAAISSKIDTKSDFDQKMLQSTLKCYKKEATFLFY